MHECIERVKREIEEVECFKKSFFEKTKAWFDAEGKNIDTKEFGECVDIVKDLAEISEKCWKSLYYQLLVRTMNEDYEEDEHARHEMERMGYNPNHYRSSGRFASAGHGTRYGYPIWNDTMWPRMVDHTRGYHDGEGSIETGYGRNAKPDEVEYGMAYNRYKEARRHYTETKDEHEKTAMKHHAEEHFDKSVKTLREIWKDVDPALRARMKNDLTALCNEIQP